MKIYCVAFISLLVVFFSGCSQRTISVGLASSEETILAGRFYAKDYSKVDQAPTYSRIRVFDLTNDCQIPSCPLMWQVVVSNTASPTQITYGVLPSFGALTMVAAKELKMNHRYRIILDQTNDIPRSETGFFDFSVDESGRLIPEIE